jgi:hypothetical protein
MEAALETHRVTVSSPTGSVIPLSGGSQAKMRFLGGWFVNPGVLPKTGTLVREWTPEGEVEVKLHLEESMGFGVLDRKLARRYSETFEGIAASIQQALAGVTNECRQHQDDRF